MQTGWVVNLQIALAPLLLFGAKLAILRDAGEEEFLPAEVALVPMGGMVGTARAGLDCSFEAPVLSSRAPGPGARATIWGFAHIPL